MDVWTFCRADIITESQAKGIGNFVSKFALPALLFKNMVLLDFGDVIWAFLWSVLVAKVRLCFEAEAYIQSGRLSSAHFFLSLSSFSQSFIHSLFFTK